MTLKDFKMPMRNTEELRAVKVTLRGLNVANSKENYDYLKVLLTG